MAGPSPDMIRRMQLGNPQMQQVRDSSPTGLKIGDQLPRAPTAAPKLDDQPSLISVQQKRKAELEAMHNQQAQQQPQIPDLTRPSPAMIEQLMKYMNYAMAGDRSR